MQLLKRHLAPVVRECLDAFRIVEIHGARQSGKTTLAQQIATERGGRLLSLDDPILRESALNDPVGFVEQYPERAARS